jgi:pimeloyl-ACP methyl ester carboxylesterase
MSTFALVHGAWHGAWCWKKLTPELESKGHRVITMDLPCDDGSATFDDYADVVCAALGDEPGDDLCLVGHSLAGNTIPLVAARRSVHRLVYLCALIPIPGRPLAQQMAEDAEMLNPDYSKGLSEKDADGRRTWIDKDLACFHMFGDCDEETASAAFERLSPQATHAYRQPFSLSELPDIDSTYVLCAEDRLVNPQWSRRIAPERLKADVVELPGSHSPFLSRPGELAELLVRLA